MWIPVRVPALRSVSGKVKLFISSALQRKVQSALQLSLVLPSTAAVVVVAEEEKKKEDVAVVIEGESKDALDVSGIEF